MTLLLFCVNFMFVKLNSKELSLSSRHYANLINSLSGYKSAHLMGTVSADGYENLTLLSSVVHVGSDPACVGIIFRPHTVEKHGFENMLDSGYLTLNAVNSTFYKSAHQSSARYSRNQSEFDSVNLSPEYRDNFYAPFVKEASVKYALRLVERYDIQYNPTHFIVAAIEAVYVPESIICKDGFLDLSKASVMTISGLDAYCSVVLEDRLPYAKQ